MKYRLEKYNSIRQKHKCPNCGKKKFVRYVISATGKYLSDHVGKCDREDNCNYHYTPGMYFKDGGKKPDIDNLHVPYSPENVVMLDYSLIKRSQKSLNENLINYLKLSRSDCELWNIGTINLYGERRIIFWQVDNDNVVHAGKIMGYGTNGKRNKFNHGVHKLIYGNKDYTMRQCFFGQHLTTPNKRELVNIVESEKTAIWAWLKFGGVWLASGSMRSLNVYKMRMIRGKDVILWPDTGKGLELWTDYIRNFKNIVYDIQIADQVKEYNELVPEGSDIMDYL